MRGDCMGDQVAKAEEFSDRFNIVKQELKKYRQELEARGLQIAKERGLEVVVGESLEVSANHIRIQRQGEEVDTTELIELTKTRHPQLYYQYKEKEREYDLLYEKLTEVLKELEQ